MRPIDADALMESMYHRAFETDGDTMWQSGCWVRYRAIEQVVKEQPTVDAVEVVQCKDCDRFDIATNGVNGFCNKLGVPFDVYDYCSLGERRDGEQNGSID